MNLCARCYDEVEELFDPKCEEKPELLRGAPLGMYHCPDCGAMVLAGECRTAKYVFGVETYNTRRST